MEMLSRAPLPELPNGAMRGGRTDFPLVPHRAFAEGRRARNAAWTDALSRLPSGSQLENFAEVPTEAGRWSIETSLEGKLICADARRMKAEVAAGFRCGAVSDGGRRAPSGLQNLTSVSLPAATSVGDYAFAYCGALTSVRSCRPRRASEAAPSTTAKLLRACRPLDEHRRQRLRRMQISPPSACRSRRASETTPSANCPALTSASLLANRYESFSRSSRARGRAPTPGGAS